MRGAWRGAAGALGAVLLAGCVSQAAALKNADAGRTIVILTGSDTSVSPGNAPIALGEGGMYNQLANWWNTYEEPSAGFDIEFDQIPGGATEEHSEMLAAAQAHDPSYDIYNLDSQWVSEFAADGYILPLDGRLDTSGFLGPPLESAEDAAGTLYAAPFTTDVGLLYYRSDLVTRAQVNRLHSFGDLISLARKVLATRPAGVAEGYAGQFDSYEGLTVNTLEAIWGHDRHAFGRDGTVQDPAAVTDGLRDLAGLFATHLAAASELTYTEPDTAKDFADSKAVFMRNWPIWDTELNDPSSVAGITQATSHVGVAPLPFPSALGGQDLVISASSPDPGDALQVVQFLTSLPAERCLFAVGGFPATRTAAYTPDSGDPIEYEGRPLCGSHTGDGTSPIAGTILAALRNAIPRPTTPYYTEFSALVQTQVGNLLSLASQGDVYQVEATASELVSDLDAASSGRGPPAGG